MFNIFKQVPNNYDRGAWEFIARFDTIENSLLNDFERFINSSV